MAHKLHNTTQCVMVRRLVSSGIIINDIITMCEKNGTHRLFFIVISVS